MTCQVAAANDPFYSKKYSNGNDNDDDAIASRNGNLCSSGMMTMKNERALGYYYRHAVESFDGYNESENHTNERNDKQEDDDILTSSSSYSSTLSCPNSPGSFLSPTGSGDGNGSNKCKSRSIFASYWSSPKNNNTHRVMTSFSSSSGRGSEKRKDNQTKDREDEDDDVLSRLQSLALPLVEPPASTNSINNNNVNIDNGQEPTNIRIANDHTQEYSHKVDRLEPSQQQQWKTVPAAANETKKGNPNTSSSSPPLSLPNPSPRTRRQILPSPPPSPHFEPSPPASSPIRTNIASIDSPTTSTSWSSPSSSSSSTPPFTTMPGTTFTLSPPIYYPSSPYSPIPLRESYRRTSSYPSPASSASRPWSSTSALVKKRPSHSCLRRPRYSSFSSVEDTVSKSSSSTNGDEEDAHGKCHRDERNGVEADSITSRKPRSVSDADVVLLSAAAPSRCDHRHEDARPEEDKEEEEEVAIATTHVQNARTPTSASNNTDTEKDEQQEQEEESKSISTSSELKKQVSFYSQVAVFEFAVVQNSQAYHPPVMDAKDGWSKYFGL